jgi:hypothetical protein
MSDDNPLGSDGLHAFYAVDVTGSITLLVGDPPQWKRGFYKLGQDITQPGSIGQLRLFSSEDAMQVNVVPLYDYVTLTHSLQNSEEPVSERLVDKNTLVADVTGEVEGALYCFVVEADGERMFFSCKNDSDKAKWLAGFRLFAKSAASFNAKSLSSDSAARPPPPSGSPPPPSHSPSSKGKVSPAAASARVDVMKFSERLDCFPELCTRLEHAWKASRSMVDFYKERSEIELQCARAIAKLHKDTSEKSMFNKRTITELEVAPSVAMAWGAMEVQASAAADGHRSFSMKVAAISSDLASFLKERGDKRKQYMSDGEKRLRDLKDATDHESKMKAQLEKARADAAAGKSSGGLFGKKPVPIEELEASHVAATSALKDKSDLYRKDMPNILEGLEQIERARLNCVHRCMRSYMDFQVETLIHQQTQWPETNSAIDSIQIDADLGAFVSSLSSVSVLKSEQQQQEAP